MNTISYIMAAFAVLGALDRIFGCRLGIGKQFEKGFLLLGELVLAMLGMIIITPAIASFLSPVFEFVYTTFKIDPSIIPSSIIANDMGGAILATEVAKNSQIGAFNGLVIASMMGATVSFTIPIALSSVNKEKQKSLLLGLLCGIVTIPFGAFVGGLICKIQIGVLLLNLLPLILFALTIGISLILIPNICVKVFNIFGIFIKIIITLGLIFGILKALTGLEIIKGLNSMTYSIEICLSIAVFLSGAFPLLFILSKIISKPMKALSRVLKISENSTLGFVSTLATNISTFEMMNQMDAKGVMLNAAFAVSASFILADHLAFTLSFNESYLLPMIIAKLTSGICAVIFALILYNKVNKKIEKTN